MSDERITRALQQATDTAEVVIGSDVIASVSATFHRAFGERATAAIVCDETTLAVAGEEVAQRLGAVAAGETIVFPGTPVLYADYAAVEQARDRLRGRGVVPVAVGSGTVNDIVKRAAHECETPYLAVATAASMDGYTAFGAAISRDGFKRTLECPAPRAVIADLEILAGAPAAMTAAGYGDLLAKYTAGADWLLADALGVEAIDTGIWSVVQDPLAQATADPAAIAAGDPAALRGLIEGLVLSGLAMQDHASSRPASGAEHQFSHLWEMEGLGASSGDGDPPLSHGYKVGLGTVAIAALYERVLEIDIDDALVRHALGAWPEWPEIERRVRAAHPSPTLADPAVEECRAKYLSRAALAERLACLQRQWPRLRERLAGQLPSADELARRLDTVGAPSVPEAISLSRAELRATYIRAQTIRRRFTVLDLLDQTGRLPSTVAALFGGDGYWSGRPQSVAAVDGHE